MGASHLCLGHPLPNNIRTLRSLDVRVESSLVHHQEILLFLMLQDPLTNNACSTPQIAYTKISQVKFSASSASVFPFLSLTSFSRSVVSSIFV